MAMVEMPSPLANSAQAQWPATPRGSPASRASPASVLACQVVIELTCRRTSPQGLQDDEIAPVPPPRRHHQLSQYGQALDRTQPVLPLRWLEVPGGWWS
jgi:hypothetical protein